MKAISGKRMCKLLEAKGWTLARVTGSHHIFVRQGSNLRVTVPVHANQDLKLGLQKSIMKLAGILEEELER
jgi:predicted RNA binding protein YcfA (HicA-like mRNA interferase family)